MKRGSKIVVQTMDTRFWLKRDEYMWHRHSCLCNTDRSVRAT